MTEKDAEDLYKALEIALDECRSHGKCRDCSYSFWHDGDKCSLMYKFLDEVKE